MLYIRVEGEREELFVATCAGMDFALYSEIHNQVQFCMLRHDDQELRRIFNKRKVRSRADLHL